MDTLSRDYEIYRRDLPSQTNFDGPYDVCTQNIERLSVHFSDPDAQKNFIGCAILTGTFGSIWIFNVPQKELHRMKFDL